MLKLRSPRRAPRGLDRRSGFLFKFFGQPEQSRSGRIGYIGNAERQPAATGRLF